MIVWHRCCSVLDFGFGCVRIGRKGKRRGRPGIDGEAMSRDGETCLVHATAVAIAGRAALILGPSGAGKSGLALRLIAGGAALVSDDQVRLTRRGVGLVARAPAPISGMIEARGVGLLRVPVEAEAPVALAVDLSRASAARMPHRETITHLGVEIDLISGRDLPDIDAVLIILLKDGCVIPV